MGLLKPLFLRNATSAVDVQKLMKADLKNSVGKKAVKFIAAKNCTIGGKKIHLFILTDTPAPFEQVLKDIHPKAYRAKGTCDVTKDKESGATQVTIKTSSGQILPDAVADLMPLVVGNDKTFVASYAKPTDKQGDKPSLKPTPKLDTGVRQWAKDQYKAQSKRTVMASMTSDGKIGSVYFDDGSRIRTTHSVGPAKEDHDKTRSVQFNVDEAAAGVEYQQSGQTGMDYDTWLKQRLMGITLSNAPKWATVIERPDQAHDRALKGTPTGSETLIEIFKSINGQYEGWHPSRGTGTKFETDKQTISVLQAAIKHVDATYEKPDDHEEQDPEIVERQNEIREGFQKIFSNPIQKTLEFLWQDPEIAARMRVLRLQRPTIEQLDQDPEINERIDEIFEDQVDRAIKRDDTINDRLEEIENIRKLRNKAFYDFVKSRLPNSEIAKAMRDPQSV
jgi:hypothetical protein